MTRRQRDRARRSWNAKRRTSTLDLQPWPPREGGQVNWRAAKSHLRRKPVPDFWELMKKMYGTGRNLGRRGAPLGGDGLRAWMPVDDTPFFGVDRGVSPFRLLGITRG